MEWVMNKIHAAPDAVKDMRNQDRAINRAIQLCGEWTKLSAALSDPATTHVASGDFMRAFGVACAEFDDAKQVAARA